MVSIINWNTIHELFWYVKLLKWEEACCVPGSGNPGDPGDPGNRWEQQCCCWEDPWQQKGKLGEHQTTGSTQSVVKCGEIQKKRWSWNQRTVLTNMSRLYIWTTLLSAKKKKRIFNSGHSYWCNLSVILTESLFQGIRCRCRWSLMELMEPAH